MHLEPRPARRPRWHRGLAGLAALSLAASPLPSLAGERTVRCESPNYRYRYCRADTDDRVELVRQISNADCRRGRNWGHDRHGIWVDNGCAAEFRVGRSGRNNDVAIGAAVVGLAAIAAIAANRQSSETQEVPSWAVGSFSGYDDFERTSVQLTVYPGGRVSGRAGGSDFTGSLKGNRLETGRHVFRIDRDGNGFAAVDERDGGHRVVFARNGSGY